MRKLQITGMQRSATAPAAGSTAAARSLAGLAAGDHVCCTFATDAERQAMVVRFAHDALEARERLAFVTEQLDEGRVRELLDSGGVDSARLLGTGQLQILAAGDVYGGPGGFDPERVISRFEADYRAARDEGFRGLAATADMSWALSEPDEWDEVIGYEREVQRIFEVSSIRGVCQYDQRLFPPGLVGEAVAAHDLAICLRDGDSEVRWRTVAIGESAASTALSLSGELDLATSAYVLARLVEQPPSGVEVVIDVSGVEFADVAGCRALLRAAEAITPGRRLVLAGVPDALARVLALTGWIGAHGLILRTDSHPDDASEGQDADLTGPALV